MATQFSDLPASCLSLMSLDLPPFDWYSLRLASRRCRDACDAAVQRVRVAPHSNTRGFCVSTFNQRFTSAAQVVLTRDCPVHGGDGSDPLDPLIVADIASGIARQPAGSWAAVTEVMLAAALDDPRVLPLPAPIAYHLPRLCPRLARVDMDGCGGHAAALLGALDALAAARHLTMLRLGARFADIAAPAALGAAALGRLRGLQSLALTVTPSGDHADGGGGGGGGGEGGEARLLQLPLAQLPELTALYINVANVFVRPSLAGMGANLCSLKLRLNTTGLSDTVRALRVARAAQVTMLSVARWAAGEVGDAFIDWHQPFSRTQGHSACTYMQAVCACAGAGLAHTRIIHIHTSRTHTYACMHT
jgi:hypothetical protein